MTRALLRMSFVVLPLLSFVLILAGCGKTQESSATPAGSTAVTELTTATFEKGIAGEGYVFLEVGGKSCAACKEMVPVLQKLKAAHPDLRVYQIYAENAPELVERFGIQLIPTQIVLGPDKKEVLRHVGKWELEEIRAELRKKQVIG